MFPYSTYACSTNCHFSPPPPPPPLPPPSISFPPGCRSLFLQAKFTFRYRARAGWARLANPPMSLSIFIWGGCCTHHTKMNINVKIGELYLSLNLSSQLTISVQEAQQSPAPAPAPAPARPQHQATLIRQLRVPPGLVTWWRRIISSTLLDAILP